MSWKDKDLIEGPGLCCELLEKISFWRGSGPIRAGRREDESDKVFTGEIVSVLPTHRGDPF